jgi:uncharacterized tellurite resistance protein B-like protein
MLRSIGDFISEITGGAREPVTFEDTDFRLAAAALLVHVATTDNNFDEAERAKLSEVLAERFDLGAEQAEELIESAIRADLEAVDLYQFTSKLNASFDEEERKKLIKMMFQVAYADGALSEFEDNIVWRAADLMHVPSCDRVTIRRRVRDESAGDEN